jgi:hypothetical protein
VALRCAVVPLQTVDMLAAATYLSGALEPLLLPLWSTILRLTNNTPLSCTAAADCRHAGCCHAPGWCTGAVGGPDCVCD